MIWLSENIIGILGIAVGVFVAYHVYFLSKKFDLKDKLVHKDAIRKRVEPILAKISHGISGKVELVNIKRYQKYYPHNNDFSKDGYTYIGAELKALRFDGVEFFSGMPKEVYKKANGKLSLSEAGHAIHENYNIFEVGIVPYEWIEYVDDIGDEFGCHPQFFVRFQGLKKYPYKSLVYYRESDTYDKNSDPMDYKYRSVIVEK